MALDAPDESQPVIRYQTGRGYAAWDASGKQVTAFYSHADRVQTRLDNMAAEASAKARRRERACLCCQEPFLSDGAHNRLCNACRRKEAGDDPVRHYITRGRRAA
jgi:hypothetical protein